jgi:4-alpha-glucanotransferase
MRFKRSSGLLLHPVSLPGRYGIGDLGDAAYTFVDFLAQSGQSFWQIMPLGPTGYGDSPYAAGSAFAGNPLLISPDRLVAEGLLAPGAVEPSPACAPERVAYGPVLAYKRVLLGKAYATFRRQPEAPWRAAYDDFVQEAAAWLDDFAVFSALKDAHLGAAWYTWPRELARREPDALAAACAALRDQIAAHKFGQYLFFTQWRALKHYCGAKGIQILGDLPLFVAHDSADVWAHPELFKLRADGDPVVVAGVPPDAFSPTGQRWGHPCYDWARLRADGFRWWIDRLRAVCTTVDVVRLDHFRGFAATWEVPAESTTAAHGHWVAGPGRALFDALQQ